MGGLADPVSAFQKKGLGNIVNSWICTGQNLHVSPDQIQKVLGSNVTKNMAAKVGIYPAGVASRLSTLLPTLVDKLTPEGKLPK